MFPMALVCGNTFVIKPSEQDPKACMLLAEMAIDSGVPPGVLNVIHGTKPGKRFVWGVFTWSIFSGLIKDKDNIEAI